MINHTDLPWKLGTIDGDILEENNSWIGEVDTLGDAKLIVKAVNSHYELLEALKLLQVRIFMLEGNSDTYNLATKAISKAEGEL